MNAREFRIGNFIHKDILNSNVEIKRHDWKVGHLDIRDAFVYGDKFNGEPIPLTAEWLTRFGFKESSNNLVFDHPAPAIPENEYKDLGKCYPAFFFNKRPEVQKWMDCHTRVTVEFVHQLQNLYFALTGEELELETVKEKI